MCQKFTPDELNSMDHDARNEVICSMQERLDKLEHDHEDLIEQIRLADQQRFGRHTEKLDDIAGQLSFFNEAEACCDEANPEPSIEETVGDALKKPRKPKKKGQREADLKEFPQEEIPHDVPEKKRIDTFGEGNYKSMPDEICWQLRFEPARWIAEKHIIRVYVGTDGLHQDEFLRGDHPDILFRGSIATASLEAAIINAKYVNSNPLDRVSRDFKANSLNLSKQTMSNWTVWSAERYFQPVYDLMKKRQLEAHVNQSDETPLEVIHDGRPAESKSYMWVHLTGELSPVPKIIVYEYRKTRHSDHPKEYYRDFHGILMTDGLEQYHKLAREQKGIVNANGFVIYDLPPAPTGKKGRPKKHGRRLSIYEDFVLSAEKIGGYYTASRRVLTNIFGERQVLAYVTSTGREEGSRRLFFSTVFPHQLSIFCAWQEKEPLNRTGSRWMQYIPLFLYSFRWNIEVSYYEQKTFWSLYSYMVRSRKGVEMLVNLNISYCAMKLLPYKEELFSGYRDSSVQAFRFALSEQIRQQVFYVNLAQTIETHIKSNGAADALKHLCLRQGIYI